MMTKEKHIQQFQLISISYNFQYLIVWLLVARAEKMLIVVWLMFKTPVLTQNSNCFNGHQDIAEPKQNPRTKF